MRRPEFGRSVKGSVIGGDSVVGGEMVSSGPRPARRRNPVRVIIERGKDSMQVERPGKFNESCRSERASSGWEGQGAR